MKSSPLGKLACDAYSQLFSVRQEALREGRGAQLTVGVGLIRWKAKEAGKDVAVEHPLVLMPADLSLDPSGALVVRLAQAAKASLWTFPGVSQVDGAMNAELDACANDYHLTGTLSPPPPTDRERWGALLERVSTFMRDGVNTRTRVSRLRRGA